MTESSMFVYVFDVNNGGFSVVSANTSSSSNFSRINNYFVAGIKGFAANVDLQPVFNHYKCTTYVCSYFTKDETECSQAITNAAKEARSSNTNIRDGLKKMVLLFSLQEKLALKNACIDVYRFT